MNSLQLAQGEGSWAAVPTPPPCQIVSLLILPSHQNRIDTLICATLGMNYSFFYIFCYAYYKKDVNSQSVNERVEEPFS